MSVLRPPVALALAREQREVPEHGRRWAYEPKFDGWRAAVFTAVGVVQSRRGNDLAARFPEIVTAAAGAGDLVLDGELVALRDGRLDFGALTSSPTARAEAGVVIYYVAFDLLAADDADLRGEPYAVRRGELVARLAGVPPPLQVCPRPPTRSQRCNGCARRRPTLGIEGIVAKDVTTRIAWGGPVSGARSARRS